jgi:hypothetical protein
MRRESFAALIFAIGAANNAVAQTVSPIETEFAKAAAALGAQTAIDNESVTVWTTVNKLPPIPHDFVAVSIAQKGTAIFGHKGETPGEAGSQTVVIELKDHQAAAYQNNSGYPAAYPRPRVIKLIDNNRVAVWAYRWNLGEPTPMHFHDKDVVVIYQDDTALKSTGPDGKSVLNEYKSGDIRFNRGNRTHTELLVRDTGSAVMIELK